MEIALPPPPLTRPVAGMARPWRGRGPLTYPRSGHCQAPVGKVAISWVGSFARRAVAGEGG